MKNEKLNLKKFFNRFYANKNVREYVVQMLHDRDFLNAQGWRRVFHDGQEGVADPFEGIVVVFDEEFIAEKYADYGFYKYNANAWIDIDLIGWREIYNGRDGSKFEVEPII